MEVEKWCGRCEILLPTSEFTKSSSSPDGLWYVCRGCRSEMRRSHKKKDPRQVKDAFLQWRYGITIEDFEAMAESQGGVCAICGKQSLGRHLDVDHDHASGFVRGLLCNDCNRAIGMLGDDPVVLVRAARYLLVSAYLQEANELRSIIADAISYDEMHSPRALPRELADRMKRALDVP
jgi:hypothetical protein